MSQEPLQRNLFPQLPIPSQAEVVEALTPHNVYLWHTIMDPWEEFLRYRSTDKNFSDLTEDEVAQWLTIQATHRARQFFDGKEGFRLLTWHRKLVILYEERLAITIKKLTKRRNPHTGQEEITRSNYLTKRNQDYWDQRRAADFPDVPRVILGYMLWKEVTEISVYVAYCRSKGRRVEWAYRMANQPSLAPPTLAPLVAVGDEEPQKGFVITPVDQAERADEEKSTGTE